MRRLIIIWAVSTWILFAFIILITSCRYVPFTSEPKCERFPDNLSYAGIKKHFVRKPDYIDYFKKTMSNDNVYRYIIYYWGTCNGETTLGYIFERKYTINEYGMSVNTGKSYNVELVQATIAEIRKIIMGVKED